MQRYRFFIVSLLALFFMGLATTAYAAGGDELAELRAATAQFHRPEVAQAAGWYLVPGLDYCFDKPGVGGMGFHYLNTSLLDLTVEVARPEALVYQTGRNGELQLGAVEYIVPAAAWDAAGHSGLPTLLGQTFHLNANLGVYVLHAWVWEHNPAGMFEDWNPRIVACGK